MMAGVLWALALCAADSAAGTATAIYVIAVGNNALPAEGSGEGLEPLAYADDDAAAFFSFTQSMATRSYLLAILDDDTQRRYPDLGRQSRPPSWQELQQVVAEVGDALRADASRGVRTEVLLYFSGHGGQGIDGAFFALTDRGLSRETLYDSILAQLPAQTVHLFIDACYAEAVVRPRDGEVSATVVDVTTADAEAWIAENTLRRFPHVGAVVATTVNQRAHEWDVYRGGIFSHQVLSGLRGAADINLDRRIEYSELHAFLSAANRAVDHPEAKLEVIVRAPEIDRRVPIVDLRRLNDTGTLDFQRGVWGHVYIETSQGDRLADLYPESGHRVSLAVPAGTELFVRGVAGEARFSVQVGGRIDVDPWRARLTTTRGRGAIASALRQGLFETPYGPMYYRGFVDRSDAVAVAQIDSEVAPPSTLPAWVAWGTAGALLVAAAVSGGLALDARADYNATPFERPAAAARERYDAMRFTSLGLGLGSLTSGFVGWWLYPDSD